MSLEPILWLSGVLVALGIIWRSPIGRVFRWVWSRLVGQPLSGAASKVIRETVSPMIEQVKAAAREQHDEQNGKLDVIRSTLASHGQRLVQIEEHITMPKERK